MKQLDQIIDDNRNHKSGYTGLTPKAFITNLRARARTLGFGPAAAAAARHDDEGIAPTPPERAIATLKAHEEACAQLGLRDAFSRVRGLVVDPGLEFAPAHIDHFPPDTLARAEKLDLPPVTALLVTHIQVALAPYFGADAPC